MFNWFRTEKAEAFAADLARFVLTELDRNTMKAHKFEAKAERTLQKVEVRLQAFKRDNKLNFYSRSKFANSFLWTLKDAGCPSEYASQLTEWLTLRL